MNEIPDESAPPPRQDSNLWGHDLFVHISAPADWCTVGQAAEHRESGIKPASLLEQIAAGEVESVVYTADEARRLLELLAQRSQVE